MDAALDARLAVLAKDLDIEATNPEIYEKVRELILDGSSFKTITIEEGGKLEKFTNLTKLSLNGTGLTSLTNFPELPNLKILELTDNYISDPVIFTIIPKLFPNLKVLHMGGNHLKNPKDVKSLSTMTSLVALGLAMNPMANDKDYREIVFESLPNLEILDQVDATGVEYNYSSEGEDEFEEEDDEDVLKKFYETEYKSDDEDDEEFDPSNQVEEEDEDFEDDDEEEDEEYGDGATSSKRPLEAEAPSTSRPKVD